ncbi:MAG TPA: hypothetical protein PL110_01000 [Candidatus Eremiobacteraeota bacterium]|nr:MAG: hypothetical protein BWY64_02674 [bacterium ADurb.Bin363]HPZ06663.1 hypothetical protein [Candidatus Eremiobacteraeota bacterium]
MKKILVMTLIMVLAMSLIAWSAETKIKINVDKDVETFNISNESGGFLIDALCPQYGNYTLYEVLVHLQSVAGEPAILQSFVDAVYNSPAGSEVFTAKISNYAGIQGAVEISANGTVHITGLKGRDYYTKTGYNTTHEPDAGVGRELFTYATSSDYYIYTGSVQKQVGSQTITYNYKCSSIGWSSPIVLDLNGDGKLDASGGNWLPHNGFVDGVKTVRFDIDGDGFEDIVEWVSANDGLLIMPGEENIVDGTSFFGNNDGYNDGYEKLASFDTNKDGVLSGSELNGMKVWIDENGDGKAAKSELKSLSSLGITEISTTATGFKSSFVQNGQRKYSWDWWPTYMSIEKVAVE